MGPPRPLISRPQLGVSSLGIRKSRIPLNPSTNIEKRRALHVLEKAGAIELLLYLYRNGETTFTNAVRSLKAGQAALYSAISRLLEAGLITEERGDIFPFTRTLKLTKKGYRVAEYLTEIEKILRSDI